jgi:hypothetical protein
MTNFFGILSYIYIYIFFLMVMRFKIRASHLLGRCSTQFFLLYFSSRVSPRHLPPLFFTQVWPQTSTVPMASPYTWDLRRLCYHTLFCPAGLKPQSFQSLSASQVAGITPTQHEPVVYFLVDKHIYCIQHGVVKYIYTMEWLVMA